MSTVPRVSEVTGKKSLADLAAEREWKKARERFNNDRSRYGYGTPEGKKAWQARIARTRSA